MKRIPSQIDNALKPKFSIIQSFHSLTLGKKKNKKTSPYVIFISITNLGKPCLGNCGSLKKVVKFSLAKAA